MTDADESQNNQDEKLFVRIKRSPAFSRREIKVLLNLVEKYKFIVQNKNVTTAVNQLKDKAWDRIFKSFNKQGFENLRSTECLKTKWENLKRSSKKYTIFDIESDDINRQVVSIMASTEDNTDINGNLSESEEEINDMIEGKEDNENDLLKLLELNNQKDPGISDGDNEQKRRMRGRSFKLEEVKVLLNLVEKHKSIILNKCTNTNVSQAKDVVWQKICKEYNKQGFKNVRSADCLKTKWENLKREAKRLSKNNYSDGIDDVMSHTVTLMSQVKDDSVVHESLLDPEEASDQEVKNNEDDLVSGCNKESDDNDDENESNRHMNRSTNFSVRECGLLLDCVKREKDNLFLKPNTPGAIRIKNRAWNRITFAYNKLSPQKRSRKALRDKFINMKKMTKGISFKNFFRDSHQKLGEEDTSEMIKSEPEGEYKELSDIEIDNVDDEQTLDNRVEGKRNTFEDDPLSTVLSSDSGVGWTNPFEDQQVTRTKQELLNYKMETAKLERKRIEDQIKSDIAYREAKQIETALRLRAARLEATTAAMKLPAAHPALQFTPEEAPAHLYLDRYHFS